MHTQRAHATCWYAPLQVRRFTKFRLGEGLEKKSQDFAAEVAAQTQAKKQEAPAAPKQEQPKEEPKVRCTAVVLGQLLFVLLAECTMLAV